MMLSMAVKDNSRHVIGSMHKRFFLLDLVTHHHFLVFSKSSTDGVD